MTPTLTHGRTMALLFSIEIQRIADIVYLLVKNEIVEVLRLDKLSEAASHGTKVSLTQLIIAFLLCVCVWGAL